MNKNTYVLCGNHKDTNIYYVWQDDCPLCLALENIEGLQNDLSGVDRELISTQDNLDSAEDTIQELKEEIEKLNNTITKLTP